MLTPSEIRARLDEMKIISYDTIRLALLSSNPESMGFRNLDNYRDFIKTNDRRSEKFLTDYEKKLDALERKLGKPAIQITDEEFASF